MTVKKSATPRKPLQRVTRSNASGSPVEIPPSTPKVFRTYSRQKDRVEDEVQAKTPKRKALSPLPDTPSRLKRLHIDPELSSLELSTSPPAEICLGRQKRVVLQAIQYSLPFDTDKTEASTNRIAYEQLTQLLIGTVDRGEGNSCIILGPSGSGKTQLVDRCISDLTNRPIIIRLSGWVQQNDRQALRELARQLMAQTTGISDIKDDDEDEDPFLVPSSSEPSTLPAAAQLHSVIPTLERPIIIIIDAFDLFTLHPRQSLLYCLFDTVQGCRTSSENKGIAVLGVTSRMDTINLLEKRVKSRFSGRMIRTAAPTSLDDWFRIARVVLSAPIEDQDEWNEAWCASVEDFLSDSNTERILKETFGVTRDVRILSRILTSAVVALSYKSPTLHSDQLAASTELQHSRPQPNYLRDLPYPAVALLVASVHAETAGYPFITFEMLHDYFRIQVRASSAAPVQVNGGSIGMLGCDRQVMLGAFERLVTLRIFIPIAATVDIAREFIKYRFALTREDVKTVVEKAGQLNLRNWLNRSQ